MHFFKCKFAFELEGNSINPQWKDHPDPTESSPFDPLVASSLWELALAIDWWKWKSYLLMETALCLNGALLRGASFQLFWQFEAPLEDGKHSFYPSTIHLLFRCHKAPLKN